MIGNTVTLFREADESLDEQIAAIIVGMAIVVCAIVAIPLAKKCNRVTFIRDHNFISSWKIVCCGSREEMSKLWQDSGAAPFRFLFQYGVHFMCQYTYVS